MLLELLSIFIRNDKLQGEGNRKKETFTYGFRNLMTVLLENGNLLWQIRWKINDGWGYVQNL